MAKVYVEVRTVINASATDVWARIRDFNGLPDWHPAIADSQIEDELDSDKVGCVRNFNLADDGGNIREKLLGLSDIDYSCTYTILDAPMPLTDYVARLNLSPLSSESACVASWTAEFCCAPADEAELTDLVGNGVFMSGLSALNEALS